MSRTRVVPTGPNNGYGPGRSLAQYHDSSMDVWFDIGDPHDTEAGALEAAKQYEENELLRRWGMEDEDILALSPERRAAALARLNTPKFRKIAGMS